MSAIANHLPTTDRMCHQNCFSLGQPATRTRSSYLFSGPDGMVIMLTEPHTTWHMSDEELATRATMISIPTPGELDGSEPVDDPPAAFATWDEWRRHRWPPSIY